MVDCLCDYLGPLNLQVEEKESEEGFEVESVEEGRKIANPPPAEILQEVDVQEIIQGYFRGKIKD